ncbi:MAG: sulfotransferase, partial [Planctomycetaceae bacterium]|nr:sulfotransferase [Planctomycetaceae bacterium]
MAKQREAKYNRYPAWAPRFWHGMRFGGWLKLLARNRFRIHPFRLPTALAITLFSMFNSLLYYLQRLVYGRRIDRTEIEPAPIFILGHWRSGTTFLHELMARDDRLSFSSSLHCFAPSHFLFTGWFFTNLGGFLLPKQRPTDNMETGWLRPQEDEFGLLAMGAASPYFRIAFPNHAAPDTCLIDMVDVPEKDLRRWKRLLKQFMKLLTFDNPGRLVLKSPPHTGRLGVLKELFPDACFIHLVRSPYDVFPSTRRLWKSLDQVQGMQVPRHDGLDEYVFSSLERMYESFEAARQSIPENQIMDMRYEDLVRDPLGSLRAVYDHFDLGNFEQVADKISGYCDEQKDYQPNRYHLEEEEKEQIQQRWGKYF